MTAFLEELKNEMISNLEEEIPLPILEEIANKLHQYFKFHLEGEFQNLQESRIYTESLCVHSQTIALRAIRSYFRDSLESAVFREALMISLKCIGYNELPVLWVIENVKEAQEALFLSASECRMQNVS